MKQQYNLTTALLCLTIMFAMTPLSAWALTASGSNSASGGSIPVSGIVRVLYQVLVN